MRRTAAVAETSAPELAAAFAAIAALQARVESQGAQILALEAQVRGSDYEYAIQRADAALRLVLAEQTKGRLFSSAELLEHAEVDDVLAAALRSRWLGSPGALGCWLRGAAGDRDGVTIIRGPRRRWQAYTSSTSDVPCASRGR